MDHLAPVQPRHSSSCDLFEGFSSSSQSSRSKTHSKPTTMLSMNAAALPAVVASLVWLCSIGLSLAGFSCVSGPCINGICIDNLNSSYSCYCEDGYTGYECQTNWDECWSSPCLNQATCVDGVAQFACVCAPGFTGELCGAEINECLSNPCMNGGTCEDLVDRYQCSCVPGYRGVNCERDLSVCNSSVAGAEEPRCLNGGRCVDGPALEYSCVCPAGWSGRRCGADLDECQQFPCENSGTCLNTPGSFACACQHGFTGPLCETEVLFCDSTLCHNGGICIMENGNATCYCVPDFHGDVCQSQYNDCLPYAPRCMNGGTCIDGVDSFACSCPSDNSGSLCECDEQGRNCLELPNWFQDRPYRPITPDIPFYLYGNVSVTSTSEPSGVTFAATPTSEVRIETDLSTESYKTTIHKPELSPTPTMLSDFPSVYTVFWTPEFPSTTSKKLESDDKTITTDSSDTLKPTQAIFVNQTAVSAFTALGFSTTAAFTTSLMVDSSTTPMVTYESTADSTTGQESITDETFIAIEGLTHSFTGGTESTLSEDPFENYTEPLDSTSTTAFSVTSTDITAETDSIVTDVQDVEYSTTQSVPLQKEYTSDETTITGSSTSAIDFHDALTSVPKLETELAVAATTAFSEFPQDDRTSTFGPTVTDIDVIAVPATLSSEDMTLEPGSLVDKSTSISSTPGIVSEGFTTLTSDETELIPTFDLSTESTEIETEITSTDLTLTTGKEFIFSTPSIRTTETSDSLPISTDSLSFESSTAAASTAPTTYTSESRTVPGVGATDPSATEETLVYQTQMPGLGYSPSSSTTEETEISSLPSDLSTPSITYTSDEPTTSKETLTSTPKESLSTPFSSEKPVDGPSSTILSTDETTSTDLPQLCTKNCLNGGTCSLINGFEMCQCPFNYTGAYCEAYRYITVPRFSGSSYLKIKPSRPLDFRSGVQVYIGFTTTASNGLVMYSEAESHGSFLMLLMRNNHLTFVFSCGVQMVSFLQANDKIPPSVILHVSFKLWWTPYEAQLPWGAGKCSASLQVNDFAPLYSEQESHSSHVVMDSLYLAGLPSHFSTKWVVKAGYQPRLEGCIHTLEIDGLELDMWRVGTEGEGVTECGESTLCPPNACLNGGTCTRAPSRWSCVCTQGFEGAFCERKSCRGSPCQRGVCVAPSVVRFSGGKELTVRIGSQHAHQLQELGGRRKREQPALPEQQSSGANKRWQNGAHNQRYNDEQRFQSPEFNRITSIERSELQFDDNQKVNKLDGEGQNDLDDFEKTLLRRKNNSSEESSEEEASEESESVGKPTKTSGVNSYETYVDMDFFHAHGKDSEVDDEDSTEAWYQQQLHEESVLTRNSVSNASAHEAKLCLCPTGYHGRFCEVADERRKRVQNKFTASGDPPMWPRYSGSATGGYSSYSAYRLPFDTRHSLYLRLHFRTWQPQQLGLLLLLGGVSAAARKDFLSLALVHGHVMLTWDVGGGPRRVVSPRPVDASLHTHSVLVGRRGKEAWMALDAQANVTGRAPGYLSSLDTDNIMFIGGHESWEFHKLPADLWRLEGFHGCVYDIRVSQQPHFYIPPKSQGPHQGPKSFTRTSVRETLEKRWFKPQLVASRNVAQCAADACADHLCQNGATCVDMGATYWCMCPVGYKGPLCSTPSHVCPGHSADDAFCAPGSSCVLSATYKGEFECICPFGKTGRFCDVEVSQSATPKFRGRRSYLTVAPVGSLRRVCHASIAFKPSSESGLIFYTSGPTTVVRDRNTGRTKRNAVGDYMALTLNNGSLTLSYKLSQAGSSGLVQSGKKVPINEWSTVTFRRKGTQADLIYGGQILRSDDDITPPWITDQGRFSTDNIVNSSTSQTARVRRAKRGHSNADAYMDVGDEIFIGGVPEMTYIPDAVGPPPARQPYRGCIGEVIVNGALYELHHQGGPMGVVRGQGLVACEDPTALVCSSSTCANGGSCRVYIRNSSQSEDQLHPSEAKAGSQGSTYDSHGMRDFRKQQTFIACDCPPSFGGSRCEVQASCSLGPCLHGGTCVPLTPSGRNKRDTRAPAVTSGTPWQTVSNEHHSFSTYVHENHTLKRLSSSEHEGKTIRALPDSITSLTDVSRAPVTVKRRTRSSSKQENLEYRCLCTPGRIGDHCQTRSRGQVSAQFRSQSYARQSEGPTNGPPDTRRDHIALNMSTSTGHGLLIWRGPVGGGRGQDWVGVGVFAGVIRVAWTLGGGRPSLLTSEARVDDGRWHSVVVARDGPSLSLYVDGRMSKATGPVNFSRRDGPATVHIGGLGDVAVATATEGLFLSSFNGCIRDVSLHAGAPTLRFDNVTGGRDLQTCSR
ncbi:EGF-like domain [Trinorchestia longiramus]|nr:EGF-like domain [Trinorchestia longiramus]